MPRTNPSSANLNLPLSSATTSKPKPQIQPQTPLSLSPSRGPWEGKFEKIYTEKLRTSSPTGLAAIRKAERELADNLRVLGEKVREEIERSGEEKRGMKKEGKGGKEVGKEVENKTVVVREVEKAIEVTKTIKMKGAIRLRRRTRSSSSGSWAGKAQFVGEFREVSGPRTRRTKSGKVPSYAASTVSSRARSCEKK